MKMVDWNSRKIDGTGAKQAVIQLRMNSARPTHPCSQPRPRDRFPTIKPGGKKAHQNEDHFHQHKHWLTILHFGSCLIKSLIDSSIFYWIIF